MAYNDQDYVVPELDLADYTVSQCPYDVPYFARYAGQPECVDRIHVLHHQ